MTDDAPQPAHSRQPAPVPKRYGTSAGLLPVHRDPATGGVSVFIGHMGGPLWAHKDERGWSVLKGEYDPTTEDAELAAEREYAEEVGAPPPPGERLDLGEHRTTGGKRIRAYAVLVADPATVSFVASNEFDMEWPPRSGRRQSFPEIDRAQWFAVEEARVKLVAGQLPLLDALVDVLAAGPVG